MSIFCSAWSLLSLGVSTFGAGLIVCGWPGLRLWIMQAGLSSANFWVVIFSFLRHWAKHRQPAPASKQASTQNHTLIQLFPKIISARINKSVSIKSLCLSSRGPIVWKILVWPGQTVHSLCCSEVSQFGDPYQCVFYAGPIPLLCLACGCIPILQVHIPFHLWVQS